MLGFEASSTRVSDSLGVCGGADHVEHEVGLGKHGDVTAFELMGDCFHALRKKTFQLRVHSAVVFADDVPARLRLPCGSPNFRLEQVGFRDALAVREKSGVTRIATKSVRCAAVRIWKCATEATSRDQ